MDHELITERFIPPETSTPMGPQLHTIYDPYRGWPGKPEDDPDMPYDDDDDDAA